MSLTPTSTQPSSPEDPDLRDRYARDAWQQREARRLSAERAAAEVPPSPVVWRPRRPGRSVGSLTCGAARPRRCPQLVLGRGGSAG